ncbi:hypothetical protein LCGC14_0476130 [marine sediment metagenome]|uniref:Uncharacterized protein n=1 Tax=marine sediment metagenome TaxID=412755 RepID=A0A0F9UXS0_9ZZZZ
MPLVTPNDTEGKDDFMSRCMGDGTMSSEFPAQEQRAAVCHSQWQRGKKRKVITAVTKARRKGKI